MCVAALIVVLFYGNYEVLSRHLMPTIIFLNTYLCLYSFIFISVCTLSNRSHMNQASTVASVSPSVYLMYALILHIQVNFQCDDVAVSGCVYCINSVSRYTICVSCISVE